MKKAGVSIFSGRNSVTIAMALMLFGVLVVYCPSKYESGKVGLFGLDHLILHMRRMTFAREAILGNSHTLPGWYPQELMGTPFWSNVQNFPFLPTRLAVLLSVDPFNALTVGAILAAGLAATFTFSFCRGAGLSPVASAASGWTFACAGFFASRLLVGHLPLLEAYPSLPLLLWLGQNALQVRDEPRQFSKRLILLGLASGCVVLAGHPQLPFYSLATAALYIVYHNRGRNGLIAIAAMGIGTGLAGFALWPMFLLARRSTRVLALDAAQNDLAFPYGRLASFFFPWKDGWPMWVNREPAHAFTEYPTFAYFWDTVCYVGWTPWLAVLALLMVRFARREKLGGPWPFFAVVGSVALLLSLPWWQSVMAHIPGTFLRSPARQLYVTTFALAFGLGAAIDYVSRTTSRSKRPALFLGIGLALAAHGFDLAIHARAFVVTIENPELIGPGAAAVIAQLVGDGRIGMDLTVTSKWNRRHEDVGFFDSIMLARTYSGLLAMSGAPPTRNIQTLNGSQLDARTLAATGVRLLVTDLRRDDLRDLASQSGIHLYAVATPADRAVFFPDGAVQILSHDQIRERLRDRTFDPASALLLRSDEVTPARDSADPTAAPATASYRRMSSDLIEVNADAQTAGWIRVLESWDSGWSAEVDGHAAGVVAGDDMFLAVHVDRGHHQIRLRFKTPGTASGIAISLCSLLALVGLARHVSRLPSGFP